MAFKIASDKAQKALRRILPKRVGNFAPDPMTDEEKKEVLLKNIAALKTKGAMLKGEGKTKTERRFIHQEILLLQKELSQISQRIKDKRMRQQPCWRDYLIQSCKELLGPEKWNEALSMADRKSMERGFRKDK